MRIPFHCLLVTALAAPLGMGTSLQAESNDTAGAASAAPKQPTTLWNFLGIPQGVQRLQDSTLNRRGNRPERERVDPLKRIADPENLKSENPAIKAAAKAKADADLAPQKIKAIKYLATLCGCCEANRDEIKDALLAALSDCTEAVRYEAALAICQCAGNPCKTCNRCTLCTADVMNKLAEMAEGQDDQCCLKEPSARVRAAAGNALEACRAVRRPTAAPAPTEASPPWQPEEKERPLPQRDVPPAPKAATPTKAASTDKPAAGPIAEQSQMVQLASYSWASDQVENPAVAQFLQPKCTSAEDTRWSRDRWWFAGKYH